jgi:peptidoglycan/LPS O-acetylase OafA/YrhL
VGRGGSQAEALRADLPFAAVYLSNWVVVHGFVEMTWSLAAEEQFYFVWPFIERFMRRLALPVVVVALVASWLIPHVIADPPSMLRETTFAPILLGVLLAHVLHRPTTFGPMARVVARRMAPLVFAVAIVGLLCLPVAEFHGLPRQLTQIWMVFFLASVVVNDNHVLVPLLQSRLAVLIGTLSYGIYILHLLCRHVAHAVLGRVSMTSGVALFAMTLVFSIGAAFASYHLFEKRILALKSRFSS